MKYKYFALDIDGTIFSSEEIIYPTYKEAIENFCKARGTTLVTPGRERIMLEIGKPVKKIFENLFPDLPDADRYEISDSILGLLCARIDKGEGEYYPDVHATVEAIRACGGKILVASNGRRPYIEAILRQLKIFDYVINPTYIDGIKIFTKGDILKTYVASGIEAKQILMVGDRLSDLEAAQAIRGDFAWCAYGHAPAGEITEYAIRLERFSDLATYA